MVDIICLFLQADSGSEFAFQGMCVCLPVSHDVFTDMIT